MKRYLVRVVSVRQKDIPPNLRDDFELSHTYLFGKGKWTFMQMETTYASGQYDLCRFSKYRQMEQYGFASKQSAKNSWAYKHAEAEKVKEDAKGIWRNWEYTIDIVEIEM